MMIGDNVEIYCGDARDRSKQFVRVDFIFTDPPYGHRNNDGDLIHKRERVLGTSKQTQVARPINNDDAASANELARWLFRTAGKILPAGGVLCCMGGGGGPVPQCAEWTIEMRKHLQFKMQVIWDKGPIGMGHHYRRSYETILVGEIPGAPTRWYDITGAVENVIRPSMIRKIIPRAEQHPTEKPWELAAFFIALHTKPGDTVFDPFMGSGSTGEAALRLGRKFVGIEQDKRWYEYARKRLERIAESPGLFTSSPKQIERRGFFQRAPGGALRRRRFMSSSDH